MSGTMQQSSSYWMGRLPSDWRCDRLSKTAEVIVSNVDKKTEDGEHAVLLCNYVDVYKNAKITAAIPFMEASATAHEIYRFAIRRGDVLATKDSENPFDIAVAATVADDLEGVLCGYHLAILRADNRQLIGPYLGWLQASRVIRAHYEMHATGVTRWAVGREHFKTCRIPIPPLSEQKRISAYLDASCAAIDRAVANKKQQLETLDALRKSIVQKVVSQGLNKDAEMRSSHVVHLAPIPSHWKVRRIKDVFQFHNHRRVPLSSAERGLMTQRTYDYYGASGAIDSVEDFIFEGRYILIAEDGANLLSRSKPLAFFADGKFWVNNHAHVLRPWAGNDVYWVNLLETLDFSFAVTGSAQPKLNMQNLGRMEIPVPPVTEQDQIARFVTEKTSAKDKVRDQLTAQVETLNSYRKSLIHECVTGKRRITDAEVAHAQAHV